MKIISETPVEIRFSDIDMAGHVHNSRYLCYFEHARIDFMRHIVSDNWEWQEKGIVLGRNEIDYVTPVYLHDKIIVKTQCDHIGSKSFTLAYELFKVVAEQEILCTKGRSILVCFDFVTGETQPIFEDWKNNLINSI